MPDGNAARVPYCRQPEFVTANNRLQYRSTANPSTLTRLFRRIRDRGFAMGPATRIEMLTDHFTARYGQRHAVVCGSLPHTRATRLRKSCGGASRQKHHRTRPDTDKHGPTRACVTRTSPFRLKEIGINAFDLICFFLIGSHSDIISNHKPNQIHAVDENHPL